MAIDASISEVPGLERAAYLTLAGEFDLKSADNFDAFWRKLIGVEKQRFFIIDVSRIADCTPVAVQVLRDFTEAAHDAYGGVAVVSPSPAVIALIRELDLAESFALFVDYKKAFEHLRRVNTEANLRLQQEKKAREEQAQASASGLYIPPPEASGSQTSINTQFYQPPAASPVKLDVTRVHVPAPAPAPAPGTVPPPVAPGASANASGGFRMRAFDAQGTLHTTDTSVTVQPGRRVLVLVAPGNEPTRKMFCDAVESAGFTPLLLFPLPEGHGFDHIANAVTQTEMVIADFAPARVRVPDPSCEVLTALTLARATIGPERLLIMTPNRTVPEIWQDVRHEQYNDQRAQLRKAIPVIVDRLRRMATALATGSPT